MMTTLKAWWMGFSKTEKIWIGIGLAFLFTLLFFLLPVRDEEERRRQIGQGVIQEAMGAAKKSLPVTPELERSFTQRFWDRLTKIFS